MAKERGSKLNENWEPREEEIQWAKTNWPAVALDRETEKFINYWISRGTIRKDWNRTYRNWIIKAAEIAETQPSGSARRSQGRTASICEANRERSRRALDKLAEIRRRSAGQQLVTSSTVYH